MFAAGVISFEKSTVSTFVIQMFVLSFPALSSPVLPYSPFYLSFLSLFLTASPVLYNKADVVQRMR